MTTIERSVEQIKQFDIPVDSYIHAVQYINEQGYLDKSDYETRVRQLLGDNSIVFDDIKQARLYYLYTIQELVRNAADGDGITVDIVRKDIDTRFSAFVTQHKWALVDDQEIASQQREQKVDANGKPKPKKGAKKELAKKVWNENKDKGYTRKQFIDILVKEVGLTPAGASTYYSNLKAGRY